MDIQLPQRKKPDHLRLKVDTGAEGNILPLRIFRSMFPNILDTQGYPKRTKVTQKPGVRLTAYDGGVIQQYGAVELCVQYRDTGWQTHTFYIANTDGPAILGLGASQELDIVSLRCDGLSYEAQDSSALPTPPFQVSKEAIRKHFPQRFDTMGNFRHTLHLYTKPRDEAPPVIQPNRKYAMHRREAMRAEIDRLVALQVIVPETDPTEWVSSVTFVDKKDGTLRMCLDPKDLNKALKRPIHKTPTLEEITHKFQGGKVFSKLDAKNGYWSIKIDEESSKLTTFNTPFASVS